MNQPGISEPELPLEWVRARDLVIAFVLSLRVQEELAGEPTSNLYPRGTLRKMVRDALVSAQKGFEKHAGTECPHVRCREEALVVAVATREATAQGRDQDDAELESLARFHEYLEGRS